MEKQPYGNQAPPPSYAPPQYTPQQGAYPPSGGPPQMAYPQSGAPPQGGYPPAGAPPQGGYPQSGAPPQGGYPPAGAPPQGGYPPAGYPPAAYPPAGSYPPHYNSPQPYSNVAVTVAPASTTTVVLTGSGVLGDVPANTQCPHCQALVVTHIDYEVGLLTWLIAGVLFFFMLWPCCLIPFCINDCKDVVHTCPNCQRVIGRRNRLG